MYTSLVNPLLGRFMLPLPLRPGYRVVQRDNVLLYRCGAPVIVGGFSPLTTTDVPGVLEKNGFSVRCSVLGLAR